MAVTMQQIADLAGVSRGTVDRALNHRGRINGDVEKNIQRIADQLGYIPKKQKKKPPRKLTIGVVTQLARTSFMEDVNRGIQHARRELKNSNVDVILEEGISVDEQEQLNAINSLESRGMDGLAIMPVDSELIREKINDLTERKNIPVVTFNTDIVGTRRVCYVGMDNTKSGETAAGLMGLLTRGVGRILVITGYFSNRVNSMRLDGFVNELKRAYPQLEIAGVQGSFDDPDEVEKITKSMLLGTQALTGILIISGGQNGVERAFRDLQIDKRPYVIAYDLTSSNEKLLRGDTIDFIIDQEGYLQGYRSLQLLSEILVRQKQPKQEFIYTDIIIKTKYNL